MTPSTSSAQQLRPDNRGPQRLTSWAQSNLGSADVTTGSSTECPAGNTCTWLNNVEETLSQMMHMLAFFFFSLSFFNTNLIRSAICQWFQTGNLLPQTFSRHKLNQVWVYCRCPLRWAVIQVHLSFYTIKECWVLFLLARYQLTFIMMQKAIS